jgi:hypothetical protein
MGISFLSNPAPAERRNTRVGKSVGKSQVLGGGKKTVTSDVQERTIYTPPSPRDKAAGKDLRGKGKQVEG